MKKLIALIALAAAGFVAYRHATHESEAYKAYKRLCYTQLHYDFESARQIVHGREANAALDKAERGYYFAQKMGLLGTHHGAGYQLESEKPAGEGVQLVVKQTVRRDPPGTTSAMGAVVLRYRHEATLEQHDGSWRVVAFSKELIEKKAR